MKRLTRTFKAHLRSMQMSENQIFGFCEGRSHDRFFYSSLLKGVIKNAALGYRIMTARELTGDAGGKDKLKAFSKFLRDGGKLSSNFKGKQMCCLLFFDKDVDCITNRRLRVENAIYTDTYDVESQLYINGNMKKAIAAVLSIEERDVPFDYTSPEDWCERKALSWVEWLTLCVFSSAYDADCGCGFGVKRSLVNVDYGPTDLVLVDDYKQRLQQRLNLTNDDFDKKFSRICKRIEKLKSEKRLHSIFKGKWLHGIIDWDLRQQFHQKDVDLSGLGSRVPAALIASLDFGEPWSQQIKNRIRVPLLSSFNLPVFR